MKLLGVIEDISHRGMYIVRASKAPRVGAKVVDRRRRDIGRVVGLLGPATMPFILVEPLRIGGKGPGLMGMEVYLP